MVFMAMPTCSLLVGVCFFFPQLPCTSGCSGAVLLPPSSFAICLQHPRGGGVLLPLRTDQCVMSCANPGNDSFVKSI